MIRCNCGEMLPLTTVGPAHVCMTATDTTPLLPYTARRCRGHWHVCVSGTDDIRTDPWFLTFDQALAIATKLNADPNAEPSL